MTLGRRVMKAPRILLAGVKGKIGKTIITSAVIKGLRERGYKVQPFKVGPDFIDPSYHTFFSGRPSRNLDSMMFSYETILNSFTRSMKNADIGVVEGVLGLYDSPDGFGEKGSTAEVAKILGSPVILILDAERVNRSLAAVLHGFLAFDPAVDVKGVIVNRVAGERQSEKILRFLRSEFPRIIVAGIIPRDERVAEAMRYRHLGLVPVAEKEKELRKLENAAEAVKEHIDFDAIVEIAESTEELPEPPEPPPQPPLNVGVGVIKDQAFSFYYPENIEFLTASSTQIHYIDALRDSQLPEIDLLYVGGGFPEIYAKMLEKNKTLRDDIRRKVGHGMKVYGECGGLIYLSDKVETFEGEEYEMVGLIDGWVKMVRKPVGHGYVRLKAIEDNLLTGAGVEVVGHEFHHSKLSLRENVKFAFKVLRGYGVDGSHDGILKENLLASYTHIHVLHNPSLFFNLLKNSLRS